MLKIKDAYEVLGLKEGASRAEIEKRFGILLKKHKMSGQEGLDNGVPEIDFAEVTKAYNLLMGYETEEAPQESQTKVNPLLRKMGVDEKKARNFFYYYKFHMIIGIIVLIVLVSTLKSCMTRVDPDLNVAFMGNFFYTDSDVLKKNLKDKLPEVKEIGIDGAMISPDGKGEQAYAMQMKAMVLLAAGDVDVFILDRENFDKTAKQGAFASLDELASSLGIEKAANKDYVLKVEGEQTEHLYGIDVSSNPVFEESQIAGEEKIAAISVKAKHYEKAVKLMELLFKKP